MMIIAVINSGKAKRSVGELLHVSEAEVFFTSGGTEANNWVIYSAIESFRSTAKDSTVVPHVITSSIEHPSVMEPLRHLRDAGSIELSLLPVDPSNGQIVLTEVEKLVSPSTCLVTVMLANNETGVLQPIADLSDAVRRASKKHGSNVFLHSDVSQAVGKIDVNIGALKVDAVSICGHKFYGPRNGALVIRSKYTTQLIPLLRGGGQQEKLRSGTENTPMIMGLGAAAAACDTERIEAKLRSVRDYFEQQLKELVPEEHMVHFSNSPRLPNTSLVAFPKYPDRSTDLMTKCKTFYASTGAACHSGSVSPILLACGVSKELAERTIRFSFGRETTKEDVDRVVRELKAVLFLAKYGSSLMNVINKGPVPGF
ncbi:Selenocysteine lyase [Trichostrongylus colubriformis]|uniref:Selenocysteine lyase n=1 Tax=Trichostrongylus colubriformis TaxID=6319 RepID=A0AAN8FE31_TRICO